MIDLWEKLHPIFETEGGGQPEIVIVNMQPSTMRYLLDKLLDCSRGLVTNCTTIHEVPVTFKASGEVVDALVSGDFIGVLSLNLIVNGLKTPSMAFIVEDVDFVTLVYEMGPDWTPVVVIALFEVFKEILKLDGGAVIGLSPYQFDKQSRVIFDKVLRDYVHEKYENGLW